MDKDTWIELGDSFLTDQPTIWKRGERVPDPDRPATTAFFHWYECQRTKTRGVRRKHRLWQVPVKGQDNLDAQLEQVLARDNVVLVDDGGNWPRYVASRAEPVQLAIP